MNQALPLVFPQGLAARPITLLFWTPTSAQLSASAIGNRITVISAVANRIIIVNSIAWHVRRDGTPWSAAGGVTFQYASEGAGIPILSTSSFNLSAVNAAGFSRFASESMPGTAYNRVPATKIAGQAITAWQTSAATPGASVTSFRFGITYYVL